MKNRFGLFFAVTLLLTGCASAHAPQAVSTVAPEGQAQQPPGGESPIADLGPRPAMSDNKAVIALLDKAQIDSGAGRHESAGAALERALRIEPRNPWLWLELAQLRLAQGQYAQAVTLARKSNSFAGGQHRVQAENWQVIGRARVAQGDTAGAEDAFKRAAEFARQANAESHHGF